MAHYRELEHRKNDEKQRHFGSLDIEKKLSHSVFTQPRHPVPPTAGSVPTASTSVTVLGLLHVINTMVPVAQAVTRTGLDLPVNMHGWVLPSLEQLQLSSWLTDNRDTTCNRENLRSVTVTLDTPILLTWLRVVVNDEVHLSAMKISYRIESSPSTECPKSNTAEINRLTMDISCLTEYPVTSVTLSGQGVKFLCSLYISADHVKTRACCVSHSAQTSLGEISPLRSREDTSVLCEPLSSDLTR
ncbi:hypothetical protein RRG08_000528 [Elysia crispata]|uniref:Uncharacterized protein n=1 Tax=Elysia crispata TaxID=231223 RepID=A0AAE0ZVX7_9GAST|nr:hypothetical protein RRG08_000528 [Elysia crispata]